MKTIDELKKIRDNSVGTVLMRTHRHGYQVIVDMGTYGIANGARDVVHAFLAGIEAVGLENATVYQTECKHETQHQVVVEIVNHEGSSVVYKNVTPEIVDEIIKSHLVGNQALTKYLLEV